MNNARASKSRTPIPFDEALRRMLAAPPAPIVKPPRKKKAKRAAK